MEVEQESKDMQDGQLNLNRGILPCSRGGSRTTKAKGKHEYSEDEDSDDGEAENLVCNMNGQVWEALPFPVAGGSGASASGMPQEWCPHAPTAPTPQSEQGEFFRAANGNKISHKGLKFVTMMIREGAQRDMRLTVRKVAKALASVSQMCRVGNGVASNPPWSQEGSYIQHLDTGKKCWLHEENGLYMFSTRAAPTSKQTSNLTSQVSLGR